VTERNPHDLSPPKPLLYAIFAMVLLTMLLVGLTKLLGLQPGQQDGPPPEVHADVLLTEANPVQERPAVSDPAGEGGADREEAQARARTQEGAGTVTVRRLEDGAVLAVLEGEESGFLRGMMRSLGRQRDVAGVPKDAPYRISRWPDGSVTFDDPATGERIAVRAFGPDNLKQVADLLRRAVEMPTGGASGQEPSQ
jgi:putative photosynthetic complex assembly protein